MQFVIISGMSGAGKSKAASDLEDLGFYCVDNMPAEMIPQFAQLCLATKGRYEKVALVTDVRASMTFDALFQALQKLDEMHLQYSIYYIEASTEVIIKRYKETRRLHPLMKDGSTLADAIGRERELLAPVRNRASAIIDTSILSTGKLRGILIDLVAGGMREHSMDVRVVSFGFKYGLPLEADLVFDVRFLPNPYYIRSSSIRPGWTSLCGILSSNISRRWTLRPRSRTCCRSCCPIISTREKQTSSSPSAAPAASTGASASQKSCMNSSRKRATPLRSATAIWAEGKRDGRTDRTDPAL